MISPFFIFVDGQPVSATAGQTAIDAISDWQPDVASAINDDSRSLTDSRGLPADPRALAHAGAIFRVVSTRQHRTSPDTASE